MTELLPAPRLPSTLSVRLSAKALFACWFGIFLLFTSGCSSTSNSSASYSHDRQSIIAGIDRAYRHWRGTPYRIGGNTKSGLDCSSLVQQTYRDQFGVAIPRTTKAQVTQGVHVNKSALQPGDLVFFKTGVDQRHVGIYLDNGRFLNASSSKGVVISRLDNPYWSKHYWRSRRIL